MIVVDASAILAILTDEPEGGALILALERADRAVASPIAIFEAAMGLRRKRHCSLAEAQIDVDDFLAAAGIARIAVEASAAAGALEAAARYGKGQQHPAQLNMGDCFAYGLAKGLGAKLLFKGEDFAMTDIEAAA